MKSFFQKSLLLLLTGIAAQNLSAQSDPAYVRADFENHSRLNPDPDNRTAADIESETITAVISYSGHLLKDGLPSASYPSSNGGIQLRESSIGQPFATWTPDPEFARREVLAARAALYPAADETKVMVDRSIADGGTAFRYKQLLFAPNSGQTVADYEGIAQWYGAPERAVVATQIANITRALTHAPQDSGLRAVLLDAYTDRAVAEMQYVKSQMVEIGKKRLALVLTSAFIIDEEIEAYTLMVNKLGTILGAYSSLLGTEMDGVDPADFDSKAVRGTPFGYYIFQSEQPSRNSVVSKYFDTAGGLSDVPQYDPVLKEVQARGVPEPFTDSDGNGFYDFAETYTDSNNNNQYDPGEPFEDANFDGLWSDSEPFTDTNDNGLRDDPALLFSGFKDYTTLLDVMAIYVQRSNELAELLGKRRLTTPTDDMSTARRLVTKLRLGTASEYCLLRGMFPENFLPVDDASGVRAAMAAVSRALAGTTNVTTFLNGSGNSLGLDPGFVIFMQGNAASDDTYDILLPNIYTGQPGSTAPLDVAIAHLETAKESYGNFRASVDTVVEDLGDLEEEYETRFTEITGYTRNEDPGFDGYNFKPGVSSELATVNRNIAALQSRSSRFLQISETFAEGISEANNAVKLADGLASVIEGAQKTYFDQTDSAWDASFKYSGIAAASDAVADAVYGVAGLDTLKSAAAPAIIVAGAVNAALQTKAAQVAETRDRTVDAAAVNMQSNVDKANGVLAAQQAKVDLSNKAIEQQGNLLDGEENTSSLAQAMADRDRLLQETERITLNFESNTLEVRGRFYADPIHLIRSEKAILDADAAFFNAQRWLFYLLRSLEYKWSSKFVAASPSGRNYDTGAIFKLRNANELKDYLDAMVSFNLAGGLGTFQNIDRLTVISLKDQILAPNPSVQNVTNLTDTGYRVDTGVTPPKTVTQLQLFRNKLDRLRNSDGDLEIPINTTALNIPNFFRAPIYSTTNSSSPITSAGQWRDKVIYVKVNIVDPDHPNGLGNPTQIGADIVYSGTSMFRTRIAPRPTLEGRLDPVPGVTSPQDFPGELIVYPYRKYSLSSFDSPLFDVTEENSAAGSFSLSNQASSKTIDGVPAGFAFNSFKELSVAATGWKLIIFRNSLQDQNDPLARIDVNSLTDIQLIISHRNVDRKKATD